MTGSPVVLELTAETAGHLWVAIERHKRESLRSGMQVPADLDDLAKVLAARAIRGQSGTPMDDLWEAVQCESVQRKLITYAEAGRALAVSERTVKRLVASGDLQAVHLSTGAARVSLTELDGYVARLTERTIAC